MAKLLSKKEKQEMMNSDLKSFQWYKGFANKHEVILLNNGEFILIDVPHIESTMYYNDEYDAPSTKEDSFVNYNLNRTFFSTFEKWVKDNEDYKRIGCCSGRLMHKVGISNQSQFENAPNCKWYGIYVDWDEQNKYSLLSDIENEEFLDCINELKERYVKRLKTYYKRYANKIHTHGYWANR